MSNMKCPICNKPMKEQIDGREMNDAPELYAIVKEWEKELKRKKKTKKDVK